MSVISVHGQHAFTTLITVPHRCVVFRWIDKGCDKNAKRFATIIHAIIKPSILFLGTVPRMICDLNRASCRLNKTRDKIRANMGPNTRLFDIHTFPHGRMSGYPNMEVGILYQSNRKYMANALGKAFRRCGLPLRWYVFGSGSTTNDILHEAVWYGVDALLIELADNLSEAQVVLVAKCLQTFRWLSPMNRAVQY